MSSSRKPRSNKPKRCLKRLSIRALWAPFLIRGFDADITASMVSKVVEQGIPMRLLFAVIFTSLLFGCNDPASEAKKAVRYELRDPESAEFRDIRIYEDGKLICGEVNANNAYGGKSGFKGFVYDDGQASLEESEYGDTAYLAGLEKCTAATQKHTEEIMKHCRPRQELGLKQK